MKEEETRASEDATMIGARKRMNCELFDERERSVNGKWALSPRWFIWVRARSSRLTLQKRGQKPGTPHGRN